jgi:integrase
MGYISYNPVAATQTVKRQVNEPTQVKPPWTQEESAKALQASIADDIMDCFVHVMLYTGLRPGEALGLRWCDIDMDRNIFHITGTLKEDRRLTPDGNGVVRLKRNDPKTLHSRRTLSIHPDLKPVLERQQMRHETWKLIAEDRWQDTGYLITTRVGTPMNPSNNRKLFYRFLDEVGVRQIRPHDLRHVVARLALEADLRIEDVSQAFGHTRIDTTKQIYAGHVQKLNDRFIQSIGDLYDTARRNLVSENQPNYRNS